MSKATLRSFDIFDTLVSRRCVHPHNIFHAVEAKAGYPGFADMRRRTERALYYRGDYSLDDIYRDLVASRGVDEDDAARLKALELAEEFDNLIPIRQHLLAVQPGDLLISDMYLPKSFVERVVREKCGLYFNPLYLSSHGKASGSAWKQLTGLLTIEQHTGDNYRGDIAGPTRHGITARHTLVARMTPGEVQIHKLRYPELARACREARLALWDPDAEKQELIRAQVELNFPLLFLASLLLVNLATSKGWKRVLFSSRDCFLFHTLFRRLVTRLGLDIETTYFLTSRLARANPSPAYLNYFDSLCQAGPVGVVDISGTGWSLTRLFEAAGRPETEIFFIHYINSPRMLGAYREIAATGMEPTVTCVTRTGDNAGLEALNAADHRMISDVIEADGVFIPTYVGLDITRRFGELIQCSGQAFMTAAAASDHIHVDTIRRWLTTVRGRHAGLIYHAAQDFSEATASIRAFHTAENTPTMALLQARVATPAPPRDAGAC